MRTDGVRIAVITAAALLLAGCARGAVTGPVIADQPGALEAVADSFSGSWSWAGRLDVEATDEAIAAFVALQVSDRPWQDPAEVERGLRTWLDWTSRAHNHGALADDGSFRIAGALDGNDLVDVRTSFRDLFHGRSLEPDLSLAIRLDWPRIRAALVEFLDVEGDEFDAGMADAQASAEEELRDEPDVLAMVRALLQGRFAGISGTVDLRASGVTEDDLTILRDHFAERVIGEAGRDQMLALLDEAVTVRDFRTDDAASVATLDIHPRAAAFAVYDLFNDAEWLARDIVGTRARAADLPETLSDVATLRFEDGWLVEVRTDVIGLARQLSATMLQDDPELAEFVRALDDARADVVFTFADHGRVATVADVTATTIEWDDLFDWLFGGSLEDALERRR